ncbi:universal stress protein [Streptomyces sp. TRM64462]|uniref:universal stress protein n=1 Tax=Streptomyces sp. TRM64462 TaxID=2741726 RepID=UPI00158664DE|nr:universal stress protein [Streptomyces sp. TRM64462]
MNHDTTPHAGPDQVRGGRQGPVVAGVDGSAPARTALLWAAAEAERHGRPLRIVHAAGTDDQRAREAGHTLLGESADLVAEGFPGLAVTQEFSPEDAVPALRDAAGTDGTIVVGSRGLGGFGELLLGSVGLGVAAHARVPVVVVRGETERPVSGRVVAGVRGRNDLDWLRPAARAAQVRGAALHLLTVWTPLAHVGTAGTLLDDIDGVAARHVHEMRVLADAIGAEFPGLTVTTEVEGGRSVAELLVQATHDAELLVLGAHHPPLGIGRAIGHVTHAVLHHAHCPVEIVPRAHTD